MQKRTKCDACAGELVFSPTHNYLMCKNCHAKYPIKLNKTIAQHSFDNTAISKKVVKTNFLTCSSCGAVIAVDNYDLLDKCDYCGSTNLSKNINEISL